MMNDRRTDSGKDAPTKRSKGGLKHYLREGGWPLLATLIVAAALKIVYQFDVHANNPLAAHPVSDEKSYIERALAISNGRWSPGEVFHQAPLYPYLLAPVLAIAEGQGALLFARIMQALAGTVSVLLLYLAARHFVSRYWAIAAAGIMTLYHPFVFFEGKLLIATTAVFLSLLSLVLLLDGACRKKWAITLFLAGLAAGAAAAARPNLLLFAPAVAAWLVLAFRKRRGWLRAACFLGGFVLPVAPFTIHNLEQGGAFVVLSDNGGVNFHLGNNAEARGSFHTTDPRWGEIEDQHRVARRIAEAETERSLDPAEVSSFWFRRGLSFIREHPLDYLGLLARKMKSFLENFEYGIIYTPGPERELTPTLYGAFVPFAAILALAAAGFAAPGLFRKSVRGDSDGKSSRFAGEAPWTPVHLLLAVNVLSVLLFFNYSRFRLTAVPALILVGVHGLAWLTTDFTRRAALRRGIALAAAGAALYLSLVPYGDQWVLQTAHGHGTIGTAFGLAGEPGKAETAYTRALELRPDLDGIINRRGITRLSLGKTEAAKGDLKRAIELRPSSAPYQADLAGLHAREGAFKDLDRATALIEEALALPTATPRERFHVLMTAGNIRMEAGDFPEAARFYREAFTVVPDDPDALFLEGVAWSRGGEMERAVAVFREVLERAPGHPGATQELMRLGR